MRDDVPIAPLAAQRATAREFLAVAFRRRWIILGLFLATTATIAIIALSRPRRTSRSDRCSCGAASR
jgi:hypothetical protein